jgi:hypothetical protein
MRDQVCRVRLYYDLKEGFIYAEASRIVVASYKPTYFGSVYAVTY